MDILRKTQKDECFLERIQHGEAEFPFRFYREDVWEFDFHRIDWHWHPEVEFVYVEKGEISCFIGTEQFILPQGCGLFVNGGVLHRYEAAESVSVPNIAFFSRTSRRKERQDLSQICGSHCGKRAYVYSVLSFCRLAA